MKKKLLGALGVVAMLMAFVPASPAAGRHPEIQAALDALRGARAHLMEARHDFHGHRADALKHVDEAIHEAEICMAE
jgi:hypothetical protein